MKKARAKGEREVPLHREGRRVILEPGAEEWTPAIGPHGDPMPGELLTRSRRGSSI